MANNTKRPNNYAVRNRSGSTVVYSIPEKNVHRTFMPGETKKITFSELEQLSYQPGGRELISNFLQIMAEDVIEALDIHTENEYFMNENQIVDLLKNGSLDAFLDCLDYAPVGVIDLVKDFAIKLPLTDTRKIEAIKTKTGFDVESALRHIAEENASEDEPEEKPVQAKNNTTTSGRRTTTNYKVVNTEDKK